MIPLFSKLRKILINPYAIAILLMVMYWVDIISLHTLISISLVFLIVVLLFAAVACLIVPSAANDSHPSFFKMLLAFLLFDCFFGDSNQS